MPYDIQLNLKGERDVIVSFTLADEYTPEELYTAFQEALIELYEDLDA